MSKDVSDQLAIRISIDPVAVQSRHRGRVDASLTHMCLPSASAAYLAVKNTRGISKLVDHDQLGCFVLTVLKAQLVLLSSAVYY